MTIDVVLFLQALQNDFLDFFFGFISFLGEEYVYILIFCIVYYTYDKKMGEFMAITLGLSATVNTIIKNIVGAPRPFEKFPNDVVNLRPETAGGMSFPSGHTQNFATVLFSEAFFTNKKVMLYVSSTLVVLMMLSRMYLGVHFLEDVVVAAIIGISIAYGSFYVFNRIYNDTAKLHKLYIIIIALIFPFIFFIKGEDFFKSYGLLIGFVVGIMIEKKYIHFNMNVKVIHKALRVLFGLIIMVGVQQGFKMLFGLIAEEGTTLMNFLNMLRYFLIAFSGFGLYPFLFRKFKF